MSTLFNMRMVDLKSRIRAVIMTRMEELPLTLVDYITLNMSLTGGAISSIFHQEQVNDYDLYCHTTIGDLNNTKLMLENTDLSNLEFQSGISGEEEYSNLVVTDGNNMIKTVNAYTLPNRVQIITIGLLQDVRKNFDYVHCMPYYNIASDTLHISERQYESIRDKRLVVNNASRFTDSRYKKYTSRGWKLELNYIQVTV